MHLIVGLGNPTKQYEGTRHNVGFETIDRIAAENQIRVEEKKHKALYGSGYIEGEKVILAKPQTFMNLSGESVRAIMDFYKCTVEDLIVRLGQLLDTEDCDDLLKFLITLEIGDDLFMKIIVTFSDTLHLH